MLAGDVRFAGSEVPAEIELVGADGRSDPISIGGEESGAHLAHLMLVARKCRPKPRNVRTACQVVHCLDSIGHSRQAVWHLQNPEVGT